jgi:hypothetical protein
VPALALEYVSTAAYAEPILVVQYQLPAGVALPASISAQPTFNGTSYGAYNVPTTIVTTNGVGDTTTTYLFAGDDMEIAIGAVHGATELERFV